MKRLIPLTTAILTAFWMVLLLANTVRSGALTDRAGLDSLPAGVNSARARSVIDHRIEPRSIQSTPEYSLTRMVTITVGTSSVPLTPGLSSRWQIDMLSQQFLSGRIGLPSDASAITVTLANGEYAIDYSGPAIYITNSQGLYYEYRTDQQALRFGNQILISQTYRYNRSLHYVGTVVFTEPYEFVGVAGYAPTHTAATELHWDQAFPGERFEERRFDAAAWLVDKRFPATRPELEIATATLTRYLNHVYVTADIRNNSVMTAWAPVYVNLYDRVAPSVPPTGPLVLEGGWCTPVPVSWCSGGVNNPLPPIPGNHTVVFSAEFDLGANSGLHDIYLFVDALGGNQGLNVESAEKNNVKLAGSVMRQDFVFLPRIGR